MRKPVVVTASCFNLTHSLQERARIRQRVIFAVAFVLVALSASAFAQIFQLNEYINTNYPPGMYVTNSKCVVTSTLANMMILINAHESGDNATFEHMFMSGMARRCAKGAYFRLAEIKTVGRNELWANIEAQGLPFSWWMLAGYLDKVDMDKRPNH